MSTGSLAVCIALGIVVLFAGFALARHEGRRGTAVAAGASAAAVVLFLVRFASQTASWRRPALYWDTLQYYQYSVRFYADATLGTLKNQWRPLFTWPATLLLRAGGAAIEPATVTRFNGLFYLALYLAALAAVTRALRVRWIYALLGATTLLTAQTTIGLSTALLADFGNSAACFALSSAACCFAASRYRSRKAAVAVAVATAFGFTVRSVFLPWAALTFGAMLVDALRMRARPQAFVVLAVVGLPLGLLSWHNGAIWLLKDLFYMNSELGYWQHVDGFLKNVLWFPLATFDEFCLAQLLTLGTMAAIAWRASPGRLGPLGPAWAVWVVATVGVSVGTRAKDLRTFNMLFTQIALFVPLTCGYLERRAGRRLGSGYAGCFALALLAPLAVAMSWTGPSPWPVRLLATYLDPATLVVHGATIPGPPRSVEDLRLPALARTILEDWNRDPTHAGRLPLVFVPVATQAFNQGYLEAYPFAAAPLDLARARAGSPAKIWDVTTALFRDSVRGEPGGIPRDFFRAGYVVLLQGETRGHLNAEVEVYNKTIAERLSADDPAFCDGLVEIGAFFAPVGTIRVWRRRSPPAARAFAAIVKEFSRRDPHNYWNLPYFNAALAITPDRELAARRDTLAAASLDEAGARLDQRGRAALAQFVASGEAKRASYEGLVKF